MFARMTPGARHASDQECSSSLSEKLRKHIETTTPADQEEEAKCRGLLMLINLAVASLANRQRL